MVFMGSKRKYANTIAPIINNYIKQNGITTFWSVFCGGANLEDQIVCDKIIATDLSPTLIALHKTMQKHSEKIPTTCDRETWDRVYTEYKRLKKNYNVYDWEDNTNIPLYEIGAAEWYRSFSNRGFSGGFAKDSETRHYYDEAMRNHIKQAESKIYQSIEFILSDYKDIDFMNMKDNVVIYADSPYKGTKPYQINTKFNHDEYYDWLDKVSTHIPIFVSEQVLPERFDKFLVWSKDDVTRTAGTDNNYKACEKLWLIDNREIHND